jgi:hypothetical protein
MGLGQFDDARAILAEARQAAQQAGDRRVEVSSRLVEMFVGLYSGEQASGDALLKATAELIPVLEREAWHGELATAWRLNMLVHGIAGRYQLASEAAQRSIEHSAGGGDERLIARVGGNPGQYRNCSVR